MMRNLLKNRKGTAEVIGSIMFIVILLFFFTNVYLWHDAAVKDADAMYLKQVNAGMDLNWADKTHLVVTAEGSDIVLSRLWIVESGVNGMHLFANLTLTTNPEGLPVSAGQSVTFSFTGGSANGNAIAATLLGSKDVQIVQIGYLPSSGDKVSVLNTLGTIVATTTPLT
jgi:hypothetical protein